jgi:4-carboxymuconolactone decarboxylase
MRLSRPRLAPLSPNEWNDEQRELLTRGNPSRVLNVFATLVRHQDLYRRWMPFANHVLFKSSLSPRERELAILRIGWLCRSGYEFHQHTRIGREAGLSDTEIERVKSGPEADGWSESESVLLRAVDELHGDQFISEATWQRLGTHYEMQQVMDLVFAVGQYTLVSMALNTFGVQIEEEESG